MFAKGLTKGLINKFSFLNGAKYFSSGMFQKNLVFKPAQKYLIYFSDAIRIDLSKSIGISEESIKNITKLASNFAPTFADYEVLPNISFNGHHCVIKNTISVPKK